MEGLGEGGSQVGALSFLGRGMHYSHPALHSSCNLTCPPGRYGANCAEVCGCHDGACDPLTGACHMGECQAPGLGSGTGLVPG